MLTGVVVFHIVHGGRLLDNTIYMGTTRPDGPADIMILYINIYRVHRDAAELHLSRMQHDDGARRTLKRCIHDRHAGVSSFEFKLLRRRTETSESKLYNILFYNTGTTAAYRHHYYYYPYTVYAIYLIGRPYPVYIVCVLLHTRTRRVHAL